jgi:hypothetical protein
MLPMDDEEIARSRQAVEEVGLFEFEGQVAIGDEEEEREDEEQGPSDEAEDEDEFEDNVEVHFDPKSTVTTIHCHPGRWEQLAFRVQLAIDRIADQYDLAGTQLRQL